MTEPIQSDISTPLRCRKCGSNRITVPAHSTDESMVTCTDCDDDIGRWGDVRVGILDVAKKKPAAKRGSVGRALAVARSCSGPIAIYLCLGLDGKPILVL